MKVGQLMNREVKACHPDDSLNRAAQLMWDNVCGAVPVIDDAGKPIGFLTDRDICMAAYTQGKTLAALTVSLAMAKRIVCCKVDDDLNSAMELMRAKGVRRLPAVDSDGRLVGLLSLDDLAYEAARPLRSGANYDLRERVAEVYLTISHGRVTARSPHAMQVNK